MILGIDFGTCFSTFAYMNGNIPITGTSIDAQGIPTLFMNLKGTEYFGEQCKTVEARRYSQDVIKLIKKEIRQNPKKFDNATAFRSGGQYYSGKEIIRKLLSYLIEYAKNQARLCGDCGKEELEQITVTAPVGIASGQMTATDYNQKLKEITMELTGLPANKVRILEEPIAAAISFLEGEAERNKTQTVIVFDLGGGTLDISAVEHNAREKSYTIVSKDGNLDLGGTDWDGALKDLILEKFENELDLRNFEEDEVNRFDDQVTEWKIQLTENTYVDGVVRHGRGRIMVDFTREEFDEVTEKLLDDAIETLRSVIQDVIGQRKTVSKIVLVGGSCNMPQIKKRILRDFKSFGEENILIYDPSKAIAKGAALYAKHLDIISKGEVETGITEFHNSVSHTYGFNSQRQRDHRDMIYNLLYKGTLFKGSGSIIARSSSSFVALHNNQERVSFTVYESDGRRSDDPDDCNWMECNNGEKPNGMEVTIPIPDEYLGHAEDYNCYPQFEITQDGILIFTVTDENGKIIGKAIRKK